MANFFLDNPDLVAAFDRVDLADAVGMLEHGYPGTDPDAPGSYAEAVEMYRTALELVGDISGNFIEPLSPGIDREGALLVDGEVIYAAGTLAGFRRLAEAGFMGAIIPRRFGGLNFPATVYIMMIEMVSRADAALMIMFGYQDVGEAISHLAPEAVANDFLPRYSSGEHIGAMVLTEPGGGSDLQAVMVSANQDSDDRWRLRGVKQFISNGNGQVLLVLARSEPDVKGMFGLSLFACHGGEAVKINRLEEKMGIHGSPTCELYFDDAPAFLVGKRRHGLIHVLSILNHARFSVAAQALGIAEAAYHHALSYAHQREAFGKKIYTIPAVAQMLIKMRVGIESSRVLLYAGTSWLDLRNKLEHEISRLRAEGSPTDDHKRRFGQAAKIVEFLSPAVKYHVTETAQQICLDAQQVLGGMGYMREMRVEQLVRDIRITTIYEGTSQVMVAASLPGVVSDTLGPLVAKVLETSHHPELVSVVAKLRELRGTIDRALAAADGSNKAEREGEAQGLVDAYLGLYAGCLLAEAAETDDRKQLIANRHVIQTLAGAAATLTRINHRLAADLDQVDAICG